MAKVNHYSENLVIKSFSLLISFLVCEIFHAEENNVQVIYPALSTQSVDYRSGHMLSIDMKLWAMPSLQQSENQHLGFVGWEPPTKQVATETIIMADTQDIQPIIPTMTKLKLPEDAVLKTDLDKQTIIFLKAENLSIFLEQNDSFRNLLLSEKYGEAAIDFLKAYRSFFKLVDPEKELLIITIEKDDIGYKHVRLRQVFSNIPIWGAEIIVHFNKNNHIYLINGKYMSTPVELKLQPVLSYQEVKEVVARKLPQMRSKCNDCQIGLAIFNDSKNKLHLAYQVFASVSLVEAWEILVDAETGGILQKTPTVYPQ